MPQPRDLDASQARPAGAIDVVAAAEAVLVAYAVELLLDSAVWGKIFAFAFAAFASAGDVAAGVAAACVAAYSVAAVVAGYAVLCYNDSCYRLLIDGHYDHLHHRHHQPRSHLAILDFASTRTKSTLKQGSLL